MISGKTVAVSLVFSLPRERNRVSLPNRVRSQQQNQRNVCCTANSATLSLTPSKVAEEITSPDINICFSPGGFLIPYYLGVIHCLEELGLLNGSTPISGTSAGALAAAFIVSGKTFSQCMEITREIQQQLVEQGYGRKVIRILKEALEVFLPDDVHLRATHRVGIGLTVYSPKLRRFGRVLTQFDTKLDFVDAVAASCYIPFYLGPRLGIERDDGYIYSDGMPTHFFPDFPATSPSFRSQTITVSPFPAANRVLFDSRSVDISPDLRDSSEVPSVWQILWNGLVPLRINEIESYAEKGYSDTILWAQQDYNNLIYRTKWSNKLKT